MDLHGVTVKPFDVHSHSQNDESGKRFVRKILTQLGLNVTRESEGDDCHKVDLLVHGTQISYSTFGWSHSGVAGMEPEIKYSRWQAGQSFPYDDMNFLFRKVKYISEKTRASRPRPDIERARLSLRIQYSEDDVPVVFFVSRRDGGQIFSITEQAVWQSSFSPMTLQDRYTGASSRELMFSVPLSLGVIRWDLQPDGRYSALHYY
jgi:hypothetical protein